MDKFNTNYLNEKVDIDFCDSNEINFVNPKLCFVSCDYSVCQFNFNFGYETICTNVNKAEFCVRFKN